MFAQAVCRELGGWRRSRRYCGADRDDYTRLDAGCAPFVEADGLSGSSQHRQPKLGWAIVFTSCIPHSTMTQRQRFWEEFR